MKAAAAIGLAMALALAACTTGPRDFAGRDLKPTANPSAVVATELAFARMAQEKGQWTAFRDFAAKDAVMFVPERVNAQDWLKGRADPAVAVNWQPTEVWMSCDGSYAVTKGPWQRPTGVGYFTTVWERQRNGEYEWVLDQGDALAEPMAVPEMIGAQVADCTARPVPPRIPPPAAGVDQLVGWSSDKTLQWIAEVKPDGSRWFKVDRWTGAGYEEVLRSEVVAE